MPATDETRYNQKLLHVLFGISSLAMLITTVWMLAADHYREWKDYQRTFRDVQSWTTRSRMTELDTAAYRADAEKLNGELTAALATALDNKLVEQFLAVAGSPVEKEAADDGKQTTYAQLNGYNLPDVSSALAALSDARASGAQTSDLIRLRDKLVSTMRAVVDRAEFTEDSRQQKLKFKKADLAVVQSDYSIAVDRGSSEARQEEIQAQIKRIEGEVEALTVKAEDAESHRLALEEILGKINAQEAEIRKAIGDHRAAQERLQRTLYEQQANLGKWLLELPVLDALNSPLKINQIWLPKLTLNNNFRDVPRYDRCTTCHLGIDKSLPGSPGQPAYESIHELTISLPTPPESPAISGGAEGQSPAEQKLDSGYGVRLAEVGLVRPDDVTIEAIWPNSRGAEAGLLAGDVILSINGVEIQSRSQALQHLVENVQWRKPLALVIRRGVPNPFASHPRLDLFVGSMSFHKMDEMGCTICHEGQGSATAFKWASHTPNTPEQIREWKDEHGWFNNHHWIFPMWPERFLESSCLQCHHQVVDLEPSKRFPDPPAPKVVAGFHAVQQFGCYGCHEINGYSGTRSIGPDLRAQPPFAAAANQVLADGALQAASLSGSLGRISQLAREVAAHPDRTEARLRLAELIRADAGGGADKPPLLEARSQQMAEILGAAIETPGTYRKVGPSLRYLASKVDLPFLTSWIRKPSNFRPSTKMPQFFGLWDHLLPQQKFENGKPVVDAEGNPVMENPGLDESKKFEPIEVRAVAEYLLDASQPFKYLEKPPSVTEEPSIQRGKLLFETRGCLACHTHPDFPKAKSEFGPNLGRLGAKLTGADAARWLYSWIGAPDRYHAETSMPNLFLDPITAADGTVSDPAADITVYLLSSKDWQPEAVPEVDAEALDELALMYLQSAFTLKQAQQYLVDGIPKSVAATLKGDETILVVNGKPTLRQKLLYVGRRTISKQGCAGCHDIPGYEDAKPIGTGLADWGRKESSKLAFEQIIPYLEQQFEGQDHGGDAHGHGLSPEHLGPDTGFYVDALLHHERVGFLWQKLREPRSYDYKKTQNKPYVERLRMPKFQFAQQPEEDARVRESIITFVLGLVGQPPAEQYVYRPDAQQQALIDGRETLHKFNCAGCHTLNMETWQFDYVPDDFLPPPPFNDYALLKPHFTAEQLEASKAVDRRGMGRAVVHGVPNPQVAEDDEGDPLYFFGLWQPEAINGHVWTVGGQEVPVPEARITKKRPPEGGDFARLLHPVALALEQRTNPNAKDTDAWGWVPPPLVGEGRKVQPPWLYEFLLEPYPIRPAVILRMPKFNLSDAEAARLVNYFAAADGIDSPYELDWRRQSSYLLEQEQRHPNRFDDALRLITDNNYCVKCHLIGDFTPPGSVAALAPNLDRVHQRIRPGWLEKWLANPKVLLPYTGMPQNFLPDKPADQNLFPGTAEEQLQAVVDLLLNFNVYLKNQTSIKPLIKSPATTPPNQASVPEAAASPGSPGG